MLRILSFIGDGTSETDHIGFLLERDKTTDIADALLEAVYALPWNALLLNQITEKSTTAKAILSFFQARGDNVDPGFHLVQYGDYPALMRLCSPLYPPGFVPRCDRQDAGSPISTPFILAFMTRPSQ